MIRDEEEGVVPSTDDFRVASGTSRLCRGLLTGSSRTCKYRHVRCDERRPTCETCDRLNLVCMPAKETSGNITYIHHKTHKHNQETLSLIDVFRSRMDDLQPEFQGVDVSHTATEVGSPPQLAETSVLNDNIFLTSESAFLLETYVRTVATWMDIFDHGNTYQQKVPQLAMASPLLFHCVCSFTANHLALTSSDYNHSWRLTAVKHYGEALRLLIDALSLPSHEHSLTASMLLLSYELNEAQRSEDYRRHFSGLTMLIKSRGSSAQSTGIEQANFWIYIRHEIVVALVNEKPLNLNPTEWAVTWNEFETREDVLGNQLLWILARVINFIFGPNGRSDAGSVERQGLIHEIEEWRTGQSQAFIGIIYGEKDADGFQRIYFPVVAAAAAAFCEHIIACAILYMRTNRFRVSYHLHPPLCRAGATG